MDNLKKIKKRFLDSSERAISGIENNTPFIYECDDTIAAMKLPEFLRENSDEVLERIYEHGAVLLRGFHVSTESEFEQAVTNLQGMKVMKDYFMAEPGRTLVEGCKYVYYTNKKVKTGGTLYLGGFHTENYYSCDVPHFISFWCSKPSALGGETGLVNMTKVYEGLDSNLKNKLGSQPFTANSFVINRVARRYGLSEEQVKDLCRDFGLAIEKNVRGEDVVTIYKPSIVIHPKSGKPAFIANVGSEIPKLDKYLINEFRNSYLGIKWGYHRIVWRYFPIVAILSMVKLKTLLMVIPALLKAIFSRINKSKPHLQTQPPPPMARLGSVFEQRDVRILSKLMRKHFSSFTWQKGDILLIDNLQMSHTGMPGFGSRTIRAILSSPIPLQYLATSPGCQSLDNIQEHKSLAIKIEEEILKHANPG
jgi:alpha-ketoglutarate-dependent taurine dioxygenase